MLSVDDAVQTGFDWLYTYDDLDRLIRAQRGTLSGGSISSETGDQNWTLDHAGNWDNTTYDLNADDVYTGAGEYNWSFAQNKANELTSWNNQSNIVVPAYDAAGNLTDDKRDWKYVYDAFYRLVTVKDQADDVKAEFKYNGVGHRISARYDETAPWYHFAYDERWRIVEMYEDTDTAPTEQFWNHNAGRSGYGQSSYIDDVILRLRDTNGDGTLDERRYYLQNWHHDVVALMDNTASISERANYTAYGSPIGTFSSINNRKGYAAYEIDSSIGHQYHVRHRTYKSDQGVWIQRDPLQPVGVPSLYAYAGAHPIAYLDALGLVITAPWAPDCIEGQHPNCGYAYIFSFWTDDPCPSANEGFFLQHLEKNAACLPCPCLFWGLQYGDAFFAYEYLSARRDARFDFVSPSDVEALDPGADTRGIAFAKRNEIRYFCTSDLLSGEYQIGADGTITLTGSKPGQSYLSPFSSCPTMPLTIGQHFRSIPPRWWSLHRDGPASSEVTLSWICCQTVTAVLRDCRFTPG